MNKALAFSHNFKLAHDPVNLNTAAITGARISAGKGERITVIIALGASASAATVQATLRQHTAASGGSSKDLSVANNYYLKKGSETKFTKVTPSVAAALIDVGADIDTGKAVLIIEVLPEQLDVNNGYAYFSVDLADGAVDKIASTMYVVTDADLKPAYLEDV